MSTLTESQREILHAVCDTVVPRIAQDDDPHGFFARTASDVGVPPVLEDVLAGLPPEQQAGFAQLLDALGDQGFLRSSQRSREQLMRNIALAGPQAAVGIAALTQLTLFLHYGLPDETGQNPNWATFGYPGPPAQTAQPERLLQPLEWSPNTTLEADVCIVGSGAGGGVMAGVLAARGLNVVVLDMGRYLDDADFHGLEVPAFQNSYWRGGPVPTGDMNVSLQAGSCLGGGTVINWTNSLRTTPWVREEWESEHGLEGLAGAEFDRHLDAVWERLSVNSDCSDLNAPQQRMHAAAEKLGWHFHTADRNVDPGRYSFESAGHIGFGDPTGAKRSTAKTYLKDAQDHEARLVVGAMAQRILTREGRAAGVEAAWTDPATGAAATLTVHAPQVVVACGALESPALLLRSGIGGPATGDYLRLHPCAATVGYHAEDMQAWKGAPHAGLVDEFADVGDGWGFLLEGAQYTTAIAGSALPFTGGAQHKRAMSRFKHAATCIALLRDRGHGRVTLDAEGQAVAWYSLSDEVDVRNTLLGLEQQIRLHEAAGAQQIVGFAAGVPTWRWGDDLEAFIARAQRIPLRAGGWRLFAAHQMGTCRMGTDPATSVAGPWGELHDTPGVWIGDTSAFPTSSGTNPMITVMALAHRNAEAVAAAAPSTAGAAAS